ncbi:uncharacterized protein LOC144822141 isoform X2 [Lissotriton helveticus]
MKSRKNLYQQDLKPAGTFLDVVACFSEDEWKLLHEWQNELFNNVMKEIHHALTSLGPVIASSVFSLRAKENEHQNLSYSQDLERRNDSPVARFPALNDDVILPMEQDVEVGLALDGTSKGEESIIIPHSGAGPVTSFRIIQEGEKSAISHQHSGTQDASIQSGQAVNSEDILIRIKEEDDTDFMCYQDPTVKDHMKVSRGQAVNSEDILIRIKEEDDTDFMCYQDPTVKDHMKVSRGVNTFRHTIKNQQGSHLEGASISSECENTIVHKVDATPHHSINPEYSMIPYAHSDNGFPLWSPRVKRKRNHKGKKMQFVVAKTKQSINKLTPIGSYQNMQTESELYICRKCGNCFQQSLKGTVGHQSNMDRQPNICDDCDKSFRQLTNLNNDQGEQMGEKSHKCTECGKSFRIAQSLLIHQRVHTGEKPYTCNQCGKDFRQRSHLVKHQRRHTGEKPFVCIVCERGFINSSNLKRHQQLHTRELSIP